MNTRIAILLDMNGTMVDDMKFHLQAWCYFAKKYHKEITDEEFSKMLAGRTNLETIRYICGNDTSEGEADILSAEKEALYRELYKPHLEFVKGLKDFLVELKSHNVPVGVATAAPQENVDLVIDGLNVRHLFDVIVDAGKVKRGKPFPDIFLTAAEKLNVSPDRCLVFEDSFLGLEAAKAAGMKAIGITTTHKILPNTVENRGDFVGMSYERVCEILGIEN